LGMKPIRNPVFLFFRLFGGGILGFMASVPAWIGYSAFADAIANSRTMDAPWFTTIVVCSALTYFLLPLSLRAFTGRGRKEDGGLLPPLAIKGFAIAFSALGAAVSALGVYASHWGAVIGGLLEFLTGVSLFQLANARRKRRSE